MTTTTTARPAFYIVYAPRGFRNEVSVKSFASKSEAADFASDVNNDPNAYTFEATDSQYSKAIRQYKKNVTEGGKEYAESAGYGYDA